MCIVANALVIEDEISEYNIFIAEAIVKTQFMKFHIKAQKKYVYRVTSGWRKQ